MAKKPKRTFTEKDREAAARFLEIWKREQRARGFTQDDAAHEMGVTQGAISQWLTAKIPISLKSTFKLARFLKCQPTDIRNDIGEIGFDLGELSEEAIALAIYWQDNLPPDAKDAVSRTVFSYPPRRPGPEEERTAATGS